MLTRTLLVLIVLLLTAGAWRLGRWYWRPRLVLPDALELERATGGYRVFLEVRNEGAGKSRGCRAVLLRCERREPSGWLRIEPRRSHASRDPNPPAACIPPASSRRLEVECILPDAAGAYRLEIAVLNGEEKRSSYVVDMEVIAPGASS